MKIAVFILLTSLITPSFLSASRLDELDKAPEGPHKNQMFLGAFFSMGYPIGEILTAEETFLADNIYYLQMGEIYKQLMVSHLAFTAGISYEWMPIDHLGLKAKMRYTSIIQRTIFGSDYQNWNANLYQDVSFIFGVSGHLTNRKQWGLSLTPYVGFSAAWLSPAPVAALPDISSQITDFAGSDIVNINNLTLGAELNLSIYFKGGFFLSIGFEWFMNILQFETAPQVSQAGTIYFEGETISYNHTFSCCITAGYAFSN